MKDDNSIETCQRCGGWVWHRKTPCECNRKTLEQENARLSARLAYIEEAAKAVIYEHKCYPNEPMTDSVIDNLAAALKENA